MTLHVFGSINVDHVYRVAHFPEAGETLATTGYSVGLGGKGANQAIAAAASDAEVRFIGAIGDDCPWTVKALEKSGVDVAGITIAAEATGHAIIFVEPSGENRIVIHGGANQAISPQDIEISLETAKPGDWWLAQNETNAVAESMALAKARGLKTAYAAAPFDADAVAAVMPHLDVLFVNEGEDAALAARLGAIEVPLKITTLGEAGAILSPKGAAPIKIKPFAVNAIDTTGAGDTFTGAFLAGLDAGLPLPEAGRFASAAAALSVTRPGAAEAIPSRTEIETFLAEQS